MRTSVEGGPSRMRWVLAAVVAATALAACGDGAGGSGSGTGLDRTAGGARGGDVARLQPGDRPVRFRLDTSVTPELTGFVVETLQWAHEDLGDSGPLTVHVYSDEERFVRAYTDEYAISADEARTELDAGMHAFASPGGHIWLYLPNFEQAPLGFQRLTLFHEYQHTQQQWQAVVNFQSERVGERSFVPRWLVEGCAEHLAVQASSKRGFLDAAQERATVVSLAQQSAEPLREFETRGQAEFIGGKEEAYTVGSLACERLSATFGEDSVLSRFWVSMEQTRDWNAAFVAAFGVSPDAFYADFERYRATL